MSTQLMTNHRVVFRADRGVTVGAPPNIPLAELTNQARRAIDDLALGGVIDLVGSSRSAISGWAYVELTSGSTVAVFDLLSTLETRATAMPPGTISEGFYRTLMEVHPILDGSETICCLGDRLCHDPVRDTIIHRFSGHHLETDRDFIHLQVDVATVAAFVADLGWMGDFRGGSSWFGIPPVSPDVRSTRRHAVVLPSTTAVRFAEPSSNGRLEVVVRPDGTA